MKTIETNFNYEKWIEVQALIKNVNEHNAKFFTPYASEAENLLASLLLCIENAPSGKVVPVVYGQWLDRATVKGQVYCSECGTIEKATDSNYKSRRCPNCGAVMMD